MVHLPAEIITNILQELCGPEKCSLASYSTINLSWQHSVEAHIWNSLEVDFDEFPEFQKLCTSSRRRQYLRRLCITFDGYFENTFSDGVDDTGTDTSTDSRETGNESDDYDEPDDASLRESQGSFHSGNSRDDDEWEEDDEESEEEEDGWKEWEDTETLESRVYAVKSEHERFYQEVMVVWQELRRWGHDFKLQTFEVQIHGDSLYELLDLAFEPYALGIGGQVYRPLNDGWFRSGAQPNLPQLPAIRTFVLRADQSIDLWPAMAACDLSHGFVDLSELRIHSADTEKKWFNARREFRKELAERLERLPKSIQIIDLALPYRGNIDHTVAPRVMLYQGQDVLSQALNRASTRLTSLTLELNQISPDIFWNLSCEKSPPLWTSLVKFLIKTGFETASGHYMLTCSDSKLPNRNERTVPRSIQRADMTYSDEEAEEFGDFCRIMSYNCPDPAYFDALSLSIARAANCMPKLQSLVIDIVPSIEELDDDPDWMGWGFRFVSGKRIEWKFRCPSWQVRWDQPEEAKQLWRKGFPGIEMDILTWDFDEEERDLSHEPRYKWTGLQRRQIHGYSSHRGNYKS